LGLVSRVAPRLVQKNAVVLLHQKLQPVNQDNQPCVNVTKLWVPKLGGKNKQPTYAFFAIDINIQ
jgi:hypothetical protein